mgnify:CR=1 FL=1
MTRNTRYMSTNAAPPYSPVMYGKRHTLPKTDGTPAEIKMKPKREPNRSRLATPAPATFAAPAPLCRCSYHTSPDDSCTKLPVRKALRL